MAGLSPSPRVPRIRSKETSPIPSPLLTQRLTPRLPPIVIERVAKAPCPPPPSPAPWSWYHRNCHSPRPQQLPSSRLRRFPNRSSRIQKVADPDESSIRMYLDANPDFLSDYIAEEVTARDLENWLHIKRRVDGTSPESANSYVVTSCASSNKFEMCSGYTARDCRSSSSPVEEEDVPSVVLSVRQQRKRQSFIVLNGKQLLVKLYPYRSASAEISMLDCLRHKPQTIESTTMTSPPRPKTKRKPVQSHSNGLMQSGYPDHRMDSCSRSDSFSSLLSNGSLEVHLTNGLHQTRSKSNGLYPDGSRHAASLNGHQSNGHKLSNRNYKRQSSVNGHVHSNEPCQVESANGLPRKPRRVLPDGKETPERRRPCASPIRCFTPRQLYLRKPVSLDDKKKNIISVIEDLALKVFPDAVTELYLDLQNEVYIVTQTGLEHTPEQHARIARRVIFEGVPWFLSRFDAPRLSSLPKHVIHHLYKNLHVAFIPFKYEFGAIVLEIWNTSAYTVHEKVVIQSLPQLVRLTLPYHSRYHSLLQESKMSEFLLQVAQAVFEEMLSLDQLIKKILEVAQHLVSADRASLFLVDHRNMELVSTVFDLRYETDQDSDFSKKEIRMPINKGIAGHVATSGETMNIPDAYSDQRFNKAVDEATGYRTVSILCMPIKVRGKILAVVQMVNKRDKEAFGADDESAFQVFSTFFGLALHHAKLYDKIKRKEQKYKVALEVLGYHNACTEEDVKTVLKERRKGATINYNDFALNPFDVSDIEKCKGILTMFEDLFDITKFDVTVLTRFVLTVKKNYRKVPYHNFDHGWAVANSMYVMLKHDTENRFNYNNRLSLFVASLCHDLDHRGYTNKFMSEIASPLAAIYTTSTLEHHHFNMTVTILQQDGHNIFYQMSSGEYKDVLDSIRQCILATDLAAFFPNLKKINELVLETSQFDWNDDSHRYHSS
ncbi:uncharacterized protein LOC133516972 isoform X3 [Cydia pomonella]|uniref:uncharacterized protein LOC133516972 isoform X3 n=1 Tax=Cydia pomonella TaxID=82600 RepID=UPI002ADD39CB|nr:uncharacterized protein LOC133516972 isoform X3 [Cydia pomonella]